MALSAPFSFHSPNEPGSLFFCNHSLRNYRLQRFSPFFRGRTALVRFPPSCSFHGKCVGADNASIVTPDYDSICFNLFVIFFTNFVPFPSQVTASLNRRRVNLIYYTHFLSRPPKWQSRRRWRELENSLGKLSCPMFGHSLSGSRLL